MNQCLFTPIAVNGMQLKNRVVRSATHEGLASPEGFWTEELSAALERVAAAGVGLIISGHTFVSPEGRAGRNQSAAESEECINYWRGTVENIHRAGAKVVLQLAHAGGMASDAATAVGPSPFATGKGRPPCRELTCPEIALLVCRFVTAARHAAQANFDGVQIHAAHGYLLSQFLSGFYNRRTDEYGGTLLNRGRFLFEVLEGIRNELGPDFPVLVKLNSEDFVPGGLSSADCVALCRELEARGADAIELSGGVPEAGPKLSPVRTVDVKTGEQAYYEATAKHVKSAVKIPIFLVGGIRDRATAERLLAENACDCVSLCRPLIREPELIRRWQETPEHRAECVSCNACFRPILTGKGFFCPIAKRA